MGRESIPRTLLDPPMRWVGLGCNLSRNVHYKGINTKHPDLALSRADTSIKVTVLPWTYAVYPWS